MIDKETEEYKKWRLGVFKNPKYLGKDIAREAWRYLTEEHEKEITKLKFKILGLQGWKNTANITKDINVNISSKLQAVEAERDNLLEGFGILTKAYLKNFDKLHALEEIVKEGLSCSCFFMQVGPTYCGNCEAKKKIDELMGKSSD